MEHKPLLDTLDPPTYSDKLRKLNRVDIRMGKSLAGKIPSTVKGHPHNSYPIFGNHMLSQQGIPGTLKVLLIMGIVYVPAMVIYWNSSRKHQYRHPLY